MAEDYLFDHARRTRIGLDEAVLCAHKTADQIAAAVAEARERGDRRLFTRLSTELLTALPAGLQAELDYDPVSQTAVLGPHAALQRPARVAIVTAGTSDARVAGEALRTLRYHGEDCRLLQDLGVAGLWRLMSHAEEIAEHPVVIAVAGMEGALFSVLGGLIGSVLIAVPTSTGSGVGTAGRVALDSALASCAPGIAVVNIDNGYGAACAALRTLRLLA